MKNRLIPRKRKSQEVTSPLQAEAHPFELLHRRMDQLFDDFFETFDRPWSPSNHAGVNDAAFHPTFEVSDDDKEVMVKAELPGMNEEDLDVQLDENVLTISGEKREEKTGGKKHARFSEMRYGSFQRVITLPEAVNGAETKATFKRGVLTLHIPKCEDLRTRSKRISISTE